MKTFPIRTSWLVLLTLLSACQSARPGAPTPDTQATVNAAVAATSVAQAAVQATIDAAVKATSAAIQPTTPARTATTAAAATRTATPKPAGPTATPVNAYGLTEEELAALIDQAVQEAVAATTAATTTTTTTTADSTLTSAEVQTLTTAVNTANQQIDEALALMQAYYDLYSQVSSETLALLQAIEQDLNAMATSMDAMAQSLASISSTLSQGLALAQSTISQLQATAAKAATSVANAQSKVKNLSTTLQNELTKRSNNALNTLPTNVPTDLRGAVQSVSTYVDTVRGAFGDRKVSSKELTSISQAGANATAGLKQFSGAEFTNLSNSINNTTKQLARGELPKAQASLPSIEQSARSLPSAPSPALPKVPSRP